MINRKCFLLTETAFHASYLVDIWINQLGNNPNFLGILVREEKISKKQNEQRKFVHQVLQGKKNLSQSEKNLLCTAYATLTKTELVMINLFGIPSSSSITYKNTYFLGNNLNSSFAQNLFLSLYTELTEPPFMFIFLDQILSMWWIKLLPYIINAHSAVLPYARGMFAIENIAALRDREKMYLSSGATIHYINEGVDTGSIIRAEKLTNIFTYNSLWEVKARSFMKAFNLLAQTAHAILSDTQILPVGIFPDPNLRGPNFLSKHFTKEMQKRAEDGFLFMKRCNNRETNVEQ